MRKTTRFYIGVIIFSTINFLFYTGFLSLLEFVIFRNIKFNITILGGIIFMMVELLYKRKALIALLNEYVEIDKDGR